MDEFAAPAPDPALKRLEKLVGTWMISGRTFDSKHDNISGRVAIEWLPGGLFLLQQGEIEFLGRKVESLEIVGYDPLTDTFPAQVYSNLSPVPAAYHWDVQGNVVLHWTQGSKYTGTFSDDGHVLAGGWRAEGDQIAAGNTYDAIMTREG